MRNHKAWLLALDLSGSEGILLVAGPGGLFHRAVDGNSRVSQLFVAAEEIFGEAGITPREVGLVGVARGPGSFTGVRVAVMAAKTLAFTLEVPLAAPGSLEVVAAGAAGMLDEVLVVMDARRGEVYHAVFRLEGEMPVLLRGPSVDAPDAVMASFDAHRRGSSATTGIMGTGLRAFPGAWPAHLALDGLDLDGPAILARLCRLYASSGRTQGAMALLPLYVRRPDARERADHDQGEGR